MSTKFFTNRDGNSLLKKFEGVFTHVPSIYFFDALIGYFRASGYFKVRPFLDRINRIRILVGINVDELTKQFHEKGQRYIHDSSSAKEKFIGEIVTDIENAEYDLETEKGILQFIDDLVNDKIELRTHPEKRLHAKIYIFRPQVLNEHSPCEVITGSSNLTDAGLGTYEASNYEFNVSLRDYQDVKFATEEFDQLWNESIPLLKAEADLIKKLTYITQSFTPFEVYIKLLIEYFGKRVEYDPYNIDLLLPEKFKRLKYQSDAANQGYSMMMKHNGFILADVVGLGKTVIACMIAKKFVYENGTHTKILVVFPPALESSWRRTVDDFLIKNHVEFITNGSLHKVLDRHNLEYSDPDRFDMIIVDESHKFRNDSSQMFDNLQQICKVRRTRSSEEGDDRKKIMLISATPLNNKPSDIENQLYLFQDKRNSTLDKVKNLQEFFKPLRDEYDKLKSETPFNIKKVKRIFESIRDNVVEQLVIRRTRKDIENNQEYLIDLAEQAIRFPKINPPVPIRYNFNEEVSLLFYDTITLLTGIDDNGEEADGIQYYRYRAIEFLVKKEDQDIYGNVRSISNRLSAIMKTLMVKRLESSFFAFKESLRRFQKATQNMIDMLSNDKVFIAPDIDVNKYLEDSTEKDLEELIQKKGGNNKVFETGAFSKDYLTKLNHDKGLIDSLVERWKRIGDKDPKLDMFIQDLKSKFLRANINHSGKLVIFTESKETASYLTKHLSEQGVDKILCVDSDNRKSLQDVITQNFDANLDEDLWKNDYEIIITTEVLAEGVNLHRSNVILNYDVPWNSTKLMQRIGRVNRIGTRAEQIHIFNFYPTDHANNQIRLSETAIKKLQAFHTAFGEDSQIYSILEEVGEGALYGDKLKEEESAVLTYLYELREFRKANLKEFKRIQNLPMRVRTGRSVGNLDSQFKYLNQTTLSYLKSENHPGMFYKVTSEGNVEEMSFLEAARIFKARENELGLSLHANHHEHVQKTLSFFESETQQEVIQTVSRKTLSPKENKAYSSIQLVLPHSPTDQKKKVLLRTLEMIRGGSVNKLVIDVNDFFSKTSMGDVKLFIDRLFLEVIDNHVTSVAEFGSREPEPTRKVFKPYIVLTESFIN